MTTTTRAERTDATTMRPEAMGHRPGGNKARAAVRRAIKRVRDKYTKDARAEMVPAVLRYLGLTKGGANPTKKRRRKQRQMSQRRNRA